MFRPRSRYKRPVWKVPSISNKPMLPAHLLFQFYCVALSVDERVAIYDALVRKEEGAWLKEQQEDWMCNEFRSYRYGRQMWDQDEQKAHQALDLHTPVPRGRFLSPFKELTWNSITI